MIVAIMEIMFIYMINLKNIIKESVLVEIVNALWNILAMIVVF